MSRRRKRSAPAPAHTPPSDIALIDDLAMLAADLYLEGLLADDDQA